MTAAKKKIPALRFPEFTGEWEEKRLGKGINLISGQHLSPKEYNNDKDGVPYFTGPSDFTNDIECLTKWTQKSTKIAITNDVLLTVKGSGVGSIMFLKLPEVAMGRQLMAIRAEGSIALFLYQILSMKAQHFEKLAMGNMIPGISREDIIQTKVTFPTLPEQQKIAAFLSAVDTRIKHLSRQKALLEQYKKGVIQQIFSRQIRFRNDQGGEFPDWEERKLSKVLREHGQKSQGREEVFSVSVHKGVVNQEEHLGRSFAAATTDHYNLVKPYDIVYTKSPTGDFPYGIIKQSRVDKNVIVSPLYGVFTPETPALGYILNDYFASNINTHNYLHSIIQKGAKNTINITNRTFLSKSLKLPVSKEEQQKIAVFLSALDRKIEQVGQQLEKMNAFKRGLLQQMFV